VTPPELNSEEDEDKAWITKNLANHSTRTILVVDEGRLLALYDKLIARQHALKREIAASEERQAETDDPADFERTAQLCEADMELGWIEDTIHSRLFPNQDEQARLLEELVEELSPESQREFSEVLDQWEREKQEARPRRGRLQLAWSEAEERREQAESAAHEARVAAIVDRLLSGDASAWPFEPEGGSP
jgi:hypothetical protein